MIHLNFWKVTLNKYLFTSEEIGVYSILNDFCSLIDRLLIEYSKMISITISEIRYLKLPQQLNNCNYYDHH